MRVLDKVRTDISFVLVCCINSFSNCSLPHRNATTRWTILTRARYYGDELCSKLALISVETTTHTVSLQSPQRLTEDRPLVEDWRLSNEKWKFIGVFDGAITQRQRNQVRHQEFYDWKFMRLSYASQNRYYRTGCSDRSAEGSACCQSRCLGSYVHSMLLRHEVKGWAF